MKASNSDETAKDHKRPPQPKQCQNNYKNCKSMQCIVLFKRIQEEIEKKHSVQKSSRALSRAPPKYNPNTFKIMFVQLFLCHRRVHPPPESKNHSGKWQNLYEYQRATLLLAVCQSHVIQKRLRMLGTHKNSPLVGLVVHPVCHILMSAVKQL